MIEAGITALLQADGTLSGLIGVRLYPVLVPEAPTYPCLSYQMISGLPSYTFQGRECEQARMQFDAWSDTYGGCKTVQKALRDVLDVYSGTLTDGTKLLGAFRGIGIDFFEDVPRSYRVMREYILYFVEP